MKNRVVVPAIGLILFIISCNSSLDKIKPEESLLLKKEKKEIAPAKKKKVKTPVIKNHAYGTNKYVNEINLYAAKNGYSTKYCFLVDMSLPSGRRRFFVYNLEKNTVVFSGLVAHGSCNETFLSRPKFSNAASCGCSSLGKYKVGGFYRGHYGKSYRLYGLDNSNSNAYRRAVVIHGYDCVPDEEIYPRVLCNSLGCPGVSYNFFEKLSRIIEQSEKPILLWVYR